MIDITDAVLSLVPDAKFWTDGKGGIVWHKDNTQPKPTKAAIQAELKRLKAEAPKNVKREEINMACEAAIVGGFQSSALGSPHTYDSSRDDQLNLVGAANASIDMPYTCTDANGVKTEVLHTAAQLKQVYLDGIAFKAAQLSKARTLKAQIDAAKTQAALDKIVW